LSYLDEIIAFIPQNAQEAADKREMLDFIARYPNDVLTRENRVAHVTSSGFIVNESCDRVLLAHHNIMDVWAWTGGHADGEYDLLSVAVREAKEETGITHIRPLKREIASLDILPVFGHVKRGAYVSTHLHLSVAYLLKCSQKDALTPCEGENTAVGWFPFSYFTAEHFNASDVYLYNKLIDRAKASF
jgi:8-oxo-dGTP pyrophosphatase MutT (NUDIX family)